MDGKHSVERSECVDDVVIRTALRLTAPLETHEIFAAMIDAVTHIFDARAVWIFVNDPPSRGFLVTATSGPAETAFGGLSLASTEGLLGIALSERQPVFVSDVRQEGRWAEPARVHASALERALLIPMTYADKPVGVVGVDSPRFSPRPSPAAVARLMGLTAHAALGIEHARLFQSVEQDRARLRRLLDDRRHLREEVRHLRREVRESGSFGDIVGTSAVFQDVITQAGLVAAADSTVLIEGETGTGKELVARMIHAASRRAANPFVALNCAALPDTLVESELFGYEKGAFTGAHTRTPGKFELADRGTLFFDEIGDLPLQAQAKLLRVLQEREVQRVGGARAVRVNVRIVAATNQPLESNMAHGTFRPDLFYRLSVFPIRLPPLRERGSDIPELARHFARRSAERLGKTIPDIAPAAMDRLERYSWPGNIRELQNLMERAVIVCGGTTITADMIGIADHPPAGSAGVVVGSPHAIAPEPTTAAGDPHRSISFHEAERRAILDGLEKTGWRISGRGGAAELLGLKPTTLHAKMKRLGIRRPSASSADVADISASTSESSVVASPP